MSLPSTTTTRHQLVSALGQKAPQYWGVLREYLTARISRIEFDEQVKTLLDSTQLCTVYFNPCFTLSKLLGSAAP